MEVEKTSLWVTACMSIEESNISMKQVNVAQSNILLQQTYLLLHSTLSAGSSTLSNGFRRYEIVVVAKFNLLGNKTRESYDLPVMASSLLSIFEGRSL